MKRLLLLTALVCGAILEPDEPAFSGTWWRNYQSIEVRGVKMSLTVSCCSVCIVLYGCEETVWLYEGGGKTFDATTGASRFPPPPALSKKGRCRKR